MQPDQVRGLAEPRSRRLAEQTQGAARARPQMPNRLEPLQEGARDSSARPGCYFGYARPPGGRMRPTDLRRGSRGRALARASRLRAPPPPWRPHVLPSAGGQRSQRPGPLRQGGRGPRRQGKDRRRSATSARAGRSRPRPDAGDMSMSMETTMVFPDRLAQQVDGPYGRFAMIATPAGAYVLTDQGPKDLPNPMRDELLRQVHAHRVLPGAEGGRSRSSSSPWAARRRSARSRPAPWTSPTATSRCAGSWIPRPAASSARRTTRSRRPARPVHVVSDFSDFKTVRRHSPSPTRSHVKTEG